MFCIHLDNGTVVGSYYESRFDSTSFEAPVVSQFGEDDTNVFVYYKHQSGYIAYVYSFETQTFELTYKSSTSASSVNSISPIFGNGFALFSMNTGVADMTIFKFYYYDPQMQEAVLDGSTRFVSKNYFNYNGISSSSFFSTYSGNSTIVDGIDKASYISSYNEVGRTVNDLVYLQGYNQTFYAPHNSTSIVDFAYFCSQSGSTTIGSVVYHPETNQISTWVTLTGDNQHLTVNAPAISTETEEIQLGIYYVTNVTNPINSRPILILYQCNIANCGS